MMESSEDAALGRLWREQPQGEIGMTTDIIRARAFAVEQRFRRQDLAAVAAFTFIAVTNALTAIYQQNPVERLGDGLTVAASVYALSKYFRRREAPAAALGTIASVDFCHREITRRQAMVKSFWPKVAILFGPGIILSVAPGVVGPQSMSRYVALVAGFCLLVIGVEWANRREARRLASDLESVEG